MKNWILCLYFILKYCREQYYRRELRVVVFKEKERKLICEVQNVIFFFSPSFHAMSCKFTKLLRYCHHVSHDVVNTSLKKKNNL